jgi:uncharacterized membrane protein YeiH
MKYDPEKLLFAVDLAGTLLFAIEGATAAISGNLDVLGLMVLAFATALGGGIIRDLLIGAVPPNSLRDWRYSAVVFTGAAIVFFLHRFVQGIPNGVMIVLDAAGLALFAVAGTQKALIYKMHPFIAILLGTITGVGGGTIRDMFLARIPTVLRAALCHRGHGRISCDDRGAKAGTASSPVCHPGRCRLFWAPSGQRLAALESAEGRRLSSSRSDHETVMRRSYFWGGASSAITTCAFGAAV